MKTYKIKNKKIDISSYEHLNVDIELSEQEFKELLNEYMINNGGVKPTHKRKYFVPKVGENFWYISTIGKIIKTDYDSNTFESIIKSGNCFATEQDAQDELNRRQALVRIWNNYDDKYSWDIDWENGSMEKYYIYYCYNSKQLTGSWNKYISINTELPYFKSAEDRNQFVSENESDLLTIFNIKK
jgi:hypothetical protein